MGVFTQQRDAAKPLAGCLGCGLALAILVLGLALGIGITYLLLALL